jgi:ribosomal protein S18 acetylase RimI-like enzyme
MPGNIGGTGGTGDTGGIGHRADDEIRIRPSRPAEARLLAQISIEENQTGRLRDLGPRFNALLHRHFIESRYGMSVVVEVGGEVAGNGTGLTDTRLFHRDFVLRQGIPAGLLALPHLLRWRNLRTALQGFTYFPESPADDPKAELVAMNVRTRFHRRGLATQLFFALMEEYRKLGIPAVKLGHIPESNKRAIAYWESLGSRYVRTEKLFGSDPTRVYVYDL